MSEAPAAISEESKRNSTAEPAQSSTNVTRSLRARAAARLFDGEIFIPVYRSVCNSSFRVHWLFTLSELWILRGRRAHRCRADVTAELQSLRLEFPDSAGSAGVDRSFFR